MHKMIQFLARLGVTEGLTFRARHEDGVGMFIEPNPAPTRQTLNTVPARIARRTLRRASGVWQAKPLHVDWS